MQEAPELECLETQKVEVKISSTSLIFRLPKHWTINKVKCLLVSEIPKLQFNEFQLKYRGKLLEGTHPIDHVAEQNEKIILLEVILIDSKEKFNEYYTEAMKPFLKQISHEHLPIFSKGYQDCKRKIEYPEPDPEVNDNVADELANEEPFILRILRFFGLYIMLGIVITFARLYQVGLILLIITVYGAIQYFKNQNNNQRRNQQREEVQPAQPEHAPGQQNENPPEKLQPGQHQENENQRILYKQPSGQQNLSQESMKEQKKMQNQAKRKQEQTSFAKKVKSFLLLRIFKICQVIFCFCITFFPNWTLEMHLQMNAGMIEECKKMIEKDDPSAFNGDKLKKE